MSGTDALLWTIDRDPVLRSTIVAILVLDRPPTQDDARRLFEELAEVVPRLRWRAGRPWLGLAGPRFTAGGVFDLDQHLRRVAAPAPGTLDTVLQLAQAMAATAFDPQLPLWEAMVVEGLDGGKGAVVVKLHHAVADGIGGLAALLQVTGDDETPRPPRPAPPPTTGGLLSQWQHGLATVSRLLAPTPTPCSPLARGRGVLRRLGVLDLPLADVRRSAAHLDGTVNDVFVAGVLGGLQRYHQLHGQPVAVLRGLIPVSIRRSGDRVGTNRFVPVRFLFPADVADPGERVRQVGARLRLPVHDPALRLSDALAWGLARLPAGVATMAFGSLLKGSDFVATDVPGPRGAVRLAGTTLERIYAFSPPAGAACNVSLVSVGTLACLGVTIDTAAIPDHQMLLDCFSASFAELLRVGRRTRAAGARRAPTARNVPAGTRS